MLSTVENPLWGNSAKSRLFYKSREHQQAQFAMVAKHLPTGGKRRILDVGCGYGDFVQWLPAGYIYEGIDADPDVIEVAKGLYPTRHFRCSTKLVKANVIVCIAALQNEIVAPLDLVCGMLDHCCLLVVSTVAPHKSLWPWRAEHLFPSEPLSIEEQDDFVVIVAKGNL